ncbi:Hsp70 family protein [Brugia pahangi]
MEVRKAVITVPAYFDSARNAAKLAGIEVLVLINAVALSYSIAKNNNSGIYILKLHQGVFPVLAVGGDDFQV